MPGVQVLWLSMGKEQDPHPVLTEILNAEAVRVQEDMDRIVREFLARWGKDIFAEDMALQGSNPEKPLVLVVDWVDEINMIHRMILEKAGYRVATAHTGRVMLAKTALLRPSLIVTGLNVLHFYPPAYAWALVNAARADAIPMLFVTAASERRYPLEVPRSPKARVLGKPTDGKHLLRNLRELLGS